MPRLDLPSAIWKNSYRSLVAEFHDRGEAPIPFSIALPHDDFDAFLAQLDAARRGVGIPAGFVPNTTFWLVSEGEVMGVSNLRHRLSRELNIEGGHIGYGIRPSARGKGMGHTILRLTLAEAARMGIDRALLTCSKDNAASSSAIAGAGGELESEAFVEARECVVQRWWIDTTPYA